jgi:hypothetical protein
MHRAILVLLTASALTALVATPVRAQTYDPDYPVCLHVYGRVNYYECRYTSLPQCAMSASGRPAQCVINPYPAKAAYGDGLMSKRFRRGS